MPIAQFAKLLFQLAVKFPQFLRHIPMLIRIYPMVMKLIDDLNCSLKDQCHPPEIAKDIVKGRMRFATRTGDLVEFVDSLRGLLKR